MRHLLMGLTVCLSLTLAQDAHAVSDAKAIEVFNLADRNKNKSLNKSEFRVFIKAMAKLGHKNAARAVRFGAVGFGVAFRDADKNRNGAVTLKELEAIR